MTDIQELIEKKLQPALLTKTKEVREVNARFLITITGDDGGTWLIDATATGPSVERATDKTKSDCAASISSANLKILLKDPGKALAMFFTGKLKITGDKSKAMGLTKFLKVK